MEKVTSNIENLELEAEKSLEEAREKAVSIVTKANEESQKILSTPLSLDEAKAEAASMTEKARIESEEKINASKSQAKQLKASASQKVDEIVNRMTRMITGVSD